MQYRLILIILLLISTSPHTEELSTVQRNALFSDAVHIMGGNTSLAVRWVGPIRYQVIQDTATDVRSVVENVFSEISSLTDSSIQRMPTHFINASDYLVALTNSPRYDLTGCTQTDRDFCANFVVVLTSQAIIHKIAVALPLRDLYQHSTRQSSLQSVEGKNKIPCFFAPGVNSQREIKRGFVFVNSTLSEEMISTCLHEEIYQSFGLFGDVTNSEFFSFNNVVAPKKVSVYDKALLTSLYDSVFSPGTPVRTIAAKMLKKISANERTVIAELP